MNHQTPEFEVIIKGHSLIKIADGGVQVDGRDFHSDVKNLSALVDILHEILDEASAVKKPHLVAA